MLYCTKCGKPINETEKFCINCGTQVKQEQQTTKNTEVPTSKTPISSTKKQEENYTKEGRKIIGAGPKPTQKHKIPSSPLKIKKNKLLGYIEKTVLTILAIFIVIFVFTLIFPDDDDSIENSTIVKGGPIEIENNEIINSNETKISTTKKEENKEILLDDNDVNSAEKYQNGIGIEPNQYKAFELYEKFAEKGDLNAMVELADYYEQGIWVKKDTKKAIALLKQAADAGSLAAKWQLEFLEGEK